MLSDGGEGLDSQLYQAPHQRGSFCRRKLSKVFAENVRLCHLDLPPFRVCLPHLLGKGDKYYENGQSLKCNKDCEDVSQREQLWDLEHQNTC